MTLKISKNIIFGPESVNVFLFLLYVLFNIEYITGSGFLVIIRYLLCIIIFAIFLVEKAASFDRQLFYFLILCFITGVLNLFLIGNCTLTKLFNIAICSVIGYYITDKSVNCKTFALATYTNAFIIAALFAIKGGAAKIYANASNNYVSLILLMSMMLYYAKAERDDYEPSIIPALIVFVLSVVSVGRSGIASTGFLFLIVLYKKSITSPSGTRKKYMQTLFFFASSVFVVFLVILLDADLYMRVFQRFLVKGVGSRDRSAITAQYLEQVKISKLYFVAGVPNSMVVTAQKYNNNLHNSFLTMHSVNGLFMLLFVCFRLCANALRGLKRKNIVFLGSMAAFLFRGATDQMFWSTIGIIPLIFLVFYYRENGSQTANVFGKNICRMESSDVLS